MNSRCHFLHTWKCPTSNPYKKRMISSIISRCKNKRCRLRHKRLLFRIRLSLINLFKIEFHIRWFNKVATPASSTTSSKLHHHRLQLCQLHFRTGMSSTKVGTLQHHLTVVVETTTRWNHHILLLEWVKVCKEWRVIRCNLTVFLEIVN